MSDLEKMYEQFRKELQGYEDLSKLEFLLQFEPSKKDEIIKEYRDYLHRNVDEDPDDLLDYEEWIEEFEEEHSDELQEEMNTYFSDYGIEHFKSKHNNLWDIIQSGGGPSNYLRVESKWEKVTWIGYWTSDHYEGDLSQYYNTIVDIYNLDIY